MDQLQAISPTGHYALAQSLDAGGTTYDKAVVSNLSGTFTGLGNVIRNLTINAAGDNVGLFGTATSGAVIRDFGLVGGSVTGKDNVGSLVGSNDISINTGNISISNIYTTVNVNGSSGIGGLIGRNNFSSYYYINDRSINVSSSYATGKVIGGESVGGLIGINSMYNNAGGNVHSNISNSYASGDVVGTSNVGGLIGSNTTGKVSNSYASGSVTGSSVVGGLIGNNSGSIINAYATGSVSSSGYSNGYMGGLIGRNGGSISNSYATGSVSGKGNVNYIGGLVGENKGVISNTYAAGRVHIDAGYSNTYIGGLAGYTERPIYNSYWDKIATGQENALGSSSGGLNETIAIDSSTAYFHNSYAKFGTWSETASGSEIWVAKGDSGKTWVMFEGSTRPFLYSEYSTDINNAHQLQLMALDLNATYTLAKNIDASKTGDANGMWAATGFVPVGNKKSAFTGTFNGRQHTISDLVINRPAIDDAGLFGITGAEATIRDVGLIAGQVTGKNNVGALVGANNGSIHNAFASSRVNGFGSLNGGLVGSNSSTGWINGSYASGNVSGNSGIVGGLVGWNEGLISNTYASGKVSGNSNIGGSVGWNDGFISNSYAQGTVVASSSGGALVGHNGNHISGSFWLFSQGKNGVGSGDNSGATGLSDKAATQLSTYTAAGWDIAAAGGSGTIWRIDDGKSMPMLHNSLPTLVAGAQVAAFNAGDALNAIESASGNGLEAKPDADSNAATCAKEMLQTKQECAPD